MNEFCRNQSGKKALSLCHSCKEYYCEDCLEESNEFYYCRKEPCKEAKHFEASMHNEVEQSKGTELPKILIDGKAVTLCQRCIDETNPTPIKGGLFSKRDATLKNERDCCEECGSVIMDLEKSMLFFFRGIIGSYRIIKTWDLDPYALYLHRNKYISRELKE